MIVIADAGTANDVWLNHQVSSIVPEGAVEARLALLFVQPREELGALHIDNVSFKVVTAMPEPGALFGLAAISVIAVVGSRRRPRREFAKTRSSVECCDRSPTLPLAKTAARNVNTGPRRAENDSMSQAMAGVNRPGHPEH